MKLAGDIPLTAEWKNDATKTEIENAKPTCIHKDVVGAYYLLLEFSKGLGFGRSS